MIYHDDDLLLPGCLQAMFSQLVADPALSAVACNANLYYADGTQVSCMAPGHDFLKITNAYTFINRYLNPWAGGAPPLSGYMYRASCLKATYIDPSRGGKYSDIAFLLSVLMQGPFLWLSHPYSLYRQHESSDNSQFSFHEKLSLMRSLRRDFGLSKSSFVYLNAKSVYYRQYFGVQPSLPSLFIFNPRSRRVFAEAFISRMVVVRFVRSHRYRKQLANSFYRKFLSFANSI
jgi:hypothetical protein